MHDEKMRGWRLLAVWAVLLVASWAAAIGLVLLAVNALGLALLGGLVCAAIVMRRNKAMNEELKKLRTEAVKRGTLIRVDAEDPDAVRDHDDAHIDGMYDEQGRRLGDPGAMRS